MGVMGGGRLGLLDKVHIQANVLLEGFLQYLEELSGPEAARNAGTRALVGRMLQSRSSIYHICIADYRSIYFLPPFSFYIFPNIICPPAFSIFVSYFSVPDP